MRLEDKHIQIIEDLENTYGNLPNVPEDNKQLLKVRRYVNIKDPKRRHKKTKPSVWTQEDDAFIRKHYDELEVEDLADILNRSISAVNQRRMKLGISKPRKQAWTQTDIDYLRANYRTQSHEVIAHYLGRTTQAVSKKLREVGLYKYNVRK